MNIRLFIFKTLSFFGIKRNRTIIPKINKEEIVPVLDVDTLEKGEVNGNVSLLELNIISQIVKNNNPENLFEIGTFNGRTTINLAHFSREGSKVYTLDLPKQDLNNAKFDIAKGDEKYVEKDIIGEKFQNHREKIIQLYGDSATFDFSPYYKSIDIIFIDGAHSAPYVLSDTENAFKLMREGGVMLWHDYGVWRDVVKVLNKYYKEDIRFKNAKHIEGTSLVYLKV